MSSKSEKAMRVKRQPLADLKNQRIDPNVVRSVGDPSSTKAKSLQELDKKPKRSAYDYSYKTSPSARRTARKEIGVKRTGNEIGLKGKENDLKRRGPQAKKKFELVYYPVGGCGGEPEVATGAKPPVFCSKCGTEHHLDFCPLPCSICYSPDHFGAECPCLRHIPYGAKYDRDRYYIVCRCGYPFNEELWACASCSGTRPLLKAKHCGICYVSSQHLSHECPNDKELAAFHKALRDHHLLFGWNSKMPAGI